MVPAKNLFEWILNFEFPKSKLWSKNKIKRFYFPNVYMTLSFNPLFIVVKPTNTRDVETDTFLGD